MVELVLAKNWVRVRFPAPAHNEKIPYEGNFFIMCGRESKLICFRSGIEKLLPYF